MLWAIVLLVFLAWLAYRFLDRAPFVDPANKFVLISGCDTGFGRDLSLALLKSGYKVISGCLTDQGRRSLEEEAGSPNLSTIRLDVTNSTHIEEAVDFVSQHTNNSLYALVNNAGVNVGGMVEWVDMKDFQQVMNVNCMGHIAMTKAFLPMLTANFHTSKGLRPRVVNVTSVSGLIGWPTLSAYAASKFALEAFSDCLRREVKKWGVHVSIIEPGFMKTSIVTQNSVRAKEKFDLLPDVIKQRWGSKSFHHYLTSVSEYATAFAQDPSLVINAMTHAVGSTRPQIRYLVGRSAYLMYFLSLLPASFVDWVIHVLDAWPVPEFLANSQPVSAK